MRRFFSYALLSFAVSISMVMTFIFAPPAYGQVKFLTPQEAAEKMTYPEGFDVRDYASEPAVVQPFAFTFDDRGRVWVLENLNYESRGSDTHAEGPKGRITILEDTDGDGRADKRKVFIDEIFFPTGLAVGHGGVWVGSPPNLLFIPDADGDDKPDSEPQILLDGWGRHDRHETLNSFTWGPDGWLYGCHGVFTHSKVGKPGTPDEERVPINAGVWRFHPVTKKFEVFAWGTSNPWGLDFDNHGQCFVTACVIPHLWHMVQGGRFHRQAGAHFNPYAYDDIKTIADHRHKSAHGGARFYLADAFPEKYRNRLFMCNIHDHGVLTDILEHKGSGYVGHHGDEFLMANDPQWLGFNMEIGPEGAIYIIDWHDEDICGRKVVHGETGRVWRIAWKGTKAFKPMDLAKLSNAELVKMQLHVNDWYVRQSRRILQERAVAGKLDDDTEASLSKMLKEHPSTPRKLRALWVLHVINKTDDSMLAELLNDQDEHLRAWAIRFLSEDNKVSDEQLAKFAEMAKDDESAVVRIHLASALQRVPVESRWNVLAGLVSHEEDKDDHNLPLMVWYALEPCVPNNTARALQLAKNSKTPRLAEFIARRIVGRTTSPPPPKRVVPKPIKVAAAKSVSKDDLFLWYKADGVVTDDNGVVSQWTDGTREGRHAKQADVDARPKLVKSLDGRAALKFDGKNDHFVVPHESDLSFDSTKNFSIATWVHIGSHDHRWIGIVTKSRDKEPWYGVWLDPSHHWTFGATNGNFSGPHGEKGWHHICVVQEGKMAKRFLYVDGYLTASQRSYDGSGTGDLWIGGATGVEEFFDGGLSEIRLYRRPLSHAEVVNLSENP
ncbi:MAG: putative membrane-bound dehydrogenase-like protein [Pirellulaceae bacterium]|jgi:putative membrane-bound dehydrogenase-like protein